MQRTARRGEHELTSEILHDGVMQRVATSSSSHQNHGIPEVTGVPSREPSLWRVPPSPSRCVSFERGCFVRVVLRLTSVSEWTVYNSAV